MSSNSECSDKMSFDTKTEAQNATLVAKFQRGSKLRVYKCRQCSLWHMASDYRDRNDD